MKPTDNKPEDKKLTQSEPRTSMLTSEKNLWERLQEKGYSESKIGQGFAMTWKMPKKESKNP